MLYLQGFDLDRNIAAPTISSVRVKGGRGTEEDMGTRGTKGKQRKVGGWRGRGGKVRRVEEGKEGGEGGEGSRVWRKDGGSGAGIWLGFFRLG